MKLLSLAPCSRSRSDRDEPVGLHEQVAAELRRPIGEGEARPGERLPPACDLAAVLGVNRNTDPRAMRLLRTDRGGTAVAGRAAIVPAIRGSAWITGITQVLPDPNDPFPEGYLLPDTWPGSDLQG
jgi:DNA-binding transcriptional MocR family regulator